MLSWVTGISLTDPMYFLTAGHCSGSVWGTAGNWPVYQHNSDRVGQEYITAPVVSYPNWRCPSAAKSPCTEADVLAIRYDDTVAVQYGNVANVDGSRNITGTYNVQGTISGVLNGQSITKVGATTGKTTGTVQATCVDISYSTFHHPGSVWLLCAQRANYSSGNGDSGAPVFRPYQANDQYTPAIAGLHSALDVAGNRYFTPISRIDMVFGSEFYYW